MFEILSWDNQQKISYRPRGDSRKFSKSNCLLSKPSWAQGWGSPCLQERTKALQALQGVKSGIVSADNKRI